MKFKIKSITLILVSMWILAGCAIKVDQYEPEIHFSFPNSNAVPLGQVKSTMSKWSFLYSDVTGNDALNLMKESLAQQPEADLVINYVLDTETIIYPIFIYKTDMAFEGTAVKMEVGEQELRSILEEFEYRPFKRSLN